MSRNSRHGFSVKLFSSAAEWLGGSVTQMESLLEVAGRIIVGKDEVIRLAVTALLSEGHLLLEDVPGVGKTTMVRTLARLFGLDSRRIQFTNDLLPADIIGTSVFDSVKNQFMFHPGPVFTQMVIADELNRATPKTQSALLEAMAERRVSVDGVTHQLPLPFFVVATQNPLEQSGTFPLPESQLDRFFMRLQIGFPSREAERELLKGQSRDELIGEVEPLFNADEIIALQEMVKKVHVSETILDYVQDLIALTRGRPDQIQPLSPRCALDLIRGARAWALLDGRQMVVPEDVKAIFASVVNHRISLFGDQSVQVSVDLAQRILHEVGVP